MTSESPREVRDGELRLYEDPEPWIQSNPAHRLRVRSLMLNFSDKIGDSIGELLELTHLSIKWCKFHKCLPNTISRLRKLEQLEVLYCKTLEQLPPNLGELTSLTHLSLLSCNSIKSLPDSIGELSELTHLSISECRSLKCLPNTITRLHKLELLEIYSCYELEQQQVPWDGLKSLRHLYFNSCCSIKTLPEELPYLEHLKLPICPALLANLKHPVSVQRLTLLDCRKHGHWEYPSNFNQIFNPQILIFYTSYIETTTPSFTGLRNLQKLYLTGGYFEFPKNLDELPELLLVDIYYTNIKCLPWSIAKLPKLRFLLLPWNFIIETLPSHLNDSIIVFQYKHVGKTWKQLKTEMETSYFPVLTEMATEAAQSSAGISPSGYLRLHGDPGIWIQNNYGYRSLVQFLHLDLWVEKLKDSIDSIEELSGLTHLYISGSHFLKHLPNTITNLKHLFLEKCAIDGAISDSLVKLSNLESLHLDLEFMELPPDIDLLVSLRCLSLHDVYCDLESLPNSMAKLSNLKTLELRGFHLNSLPANLNLTKLKLINSTILSISSLTTGVRHLEIIHTLGCTNSDRCPEYDLNQLVSLEKLSVSCHYMKFFPSIGGLHKLDELHLKDCFSLTTLPPDLDELVSMRTLNIIGTRIKSLPCRITKLHNLRHLFLPKCFKREDLPSCLRERPITVSIDDTDELYYQEMGYYDSKYETSTKTSNEGMLWDGVNEVDLRESRQQGIIHEHTSPHLPDAATPVHDDSHLTCREDPGENSNNAFCITQNPEMEIMPVGNEAWPASYFQREFSNSHATDFYGQSSQHALQVPIKLMSSEKGHGIALIDQHISPRAGSNLLENDALENGQTDKNLNSEDKKGKRKKTEITWEDTDGVSRCTMKQELEILNWPSSRDAKKRHINILPCSSNPSTVNFILTTEPAGHEQSMQDFDVANQQTLQGQLLNTCKDNNDSNPTATMGNVGAFPVVTQVHADRNGNGREFLNGAVQFASSTSQWNLLNEQPVLDLTLGPCSGTNNLAVNATMGRAGAPILAVTTLSLTSVGSVSISNFSKDSNDHPSADQVLRLGNESNSTTVNATIATQVHKVVQETCNGANQSTISNTTQESRISWSLVVKAQKHFNVANEHILSDDTNNMSLTPSATMQNVEAPTVAIGVNRDGNELAQENLNDGNQ